MFGKKKEIKDDCVSALNVSDCTKFVRNLAYLYKTCENWLYFDDDNFNLFKIINFEWDGPRYTSYSISQGSSVTDGKSKRTGRIIGAAIGTAIAPGVGTVIGAVHGTGNKKIKTKTISTSVMQNHEREIPMPATITIRYKNIDEIETFTITCLSNTAKILKGLIINEENDMNEDLLSKLEKLKKLLDIGAITQEEFDLKKKELLEKI